MPTEQENPHAEDEEQHPVPSAADGNIFGPGDSAPEPANQPQDMLPADIWHIFRTVFTFNTPDRSIMSNLSPEERREIVLQRGRRADQDHSFKKLLLAAGCFVFCLLLLAMVGLVVFLTLQGEIAFASEIIAGAFGMISGLFTGIGGTLGVIALRRWWQ